MHTFLFYLLKANIILMILILFYKLFFTRDTFFRLRRFALVMCYVIAFTVPLMHLPANLFFFQQEIPNLTVMYERIWTETSEIVTNDALLTIAQSSIPVWMQVLFVIYLTGILILLYRTCMELRHTLIVQRKSRKTYIQGNPVWVNPEIRSPFSFLGSIYIGEDLKNQQELSEVIVHEQTHVRQLHSIDMLLAQVVIILCWFNPAAWLIRREIRINHEYEADDAVMRAGFNKKSYQYHLIGMEYTPMAAANLYNNFSVLPLKNRLKMMNKKRTRNILKGKYLMFLPMAVLLMSFSNYKQYAEENAWVVESETVTSSEIVTSLQDPQEKVYDVVEAMPNFPGGVDALMRFLADNIKYPEAAAKDNIQGRVIVTFVVGKDGKIRGAHVARGVNELLDQEALRVVNAMPAWTPGKEKGEIVAVRYTLPVMFKL